MQPSPPALACRGLVKRYGDLTAVAGLDLEVARGECFGLLGPNGAGKTTCFYMMVGLVEPDGGRVMLGDEDITTWPMFKRARAGVAYLAQEPSAFRRLDVQDNIWMVLEALGTGADEAQRRIDALLDDFGLAALRHQRAETLSGGERRRLEVARSLAIDPTFILLDEPFAGIDPLAVIDLQRIIGHLKSLGIGILITDHNVRETLKITDRAYIIKDGKIFATGDPVGLSDNEDVRRIYLGEYFRL